MQSSHVLLAMLVTDRYGVVLPYDSICLQLGHEFSRFHGIIFEDRGCYGYTLMRGRLAPIALGGCI